MSFILAHQQSADSTAFIIMDHGLEVFLQKQISGCIYHPNLCVCVCVLCRHLTFLIQTFLYVSTFCPFHTKNILMMNDVCIFRGSPQKHSHLKKVHFVLLLIFHNSSSRWLTLGCDRVKFNAAEWIPLPQIRFVLNGHFSSLWIQLSFYTFTFSTSSFLLCWRNKGTTRFCLCSLLF